MSNSFQAQSNITLYIGGLIEHASERAMLAEALQCLAKRGAPAILLANIEVGRQIDLVVVLEGGALVLEAKGVRAPVSGRENGNWRLHAGSGRPLTYRNPLRQANEAALALRDALHFYTRAHVEYFRAGVVFCPVVPAGSDIPGSSYKVAVGNLGNLGDWLASPAGPKLSFEIWHAFARHLGLNRVPSLQAACDARLAASELLLGQYVERFVDTYSPTAAELITAQDSPLSAFIDRCARGESTILRGPSGCGKTIAAARAGVVAIEHGRVPVVIPAKYFRSKLGPLLRAEVAVLGVPRIAALLNACRRLERPLLFILDGYNECPETLRETLVRAIAELCHVNGASLGITSQIGLERSDLLDISDILLPYADLEEKAAIAERAAAGTLSPAAAAWVATVRSGFEARLIGEVQDSLGETGHRSALFDAFVRKRLGEYAPEGIRALTAIARVLSERISFSLTQRELDRLAVAEGISPVTITKLSDVRLLLHHGSRVSFAHEMYFDVFAAEAVARQATQEPLAVIAALHSPLHAARKATVLGAIDDPVMQRSILAAVDDAELVAACLAGECGAYARDWSQGVLADVIRRIDVEARQMSFCYDAGCYPPFRRTDSYANAWSTQEQAFIGALPSEFLAGRHVDQLMATVAAADECWQAEARRLREEETNPVIGFRSSLFQACYLHGTEGPAIGTLSRHVASGWLPPHQRGSAPAILASWLDRSNLTLGQLYLLLGLARVSGDETSALAKRLPSLLRTVYLPAPYHLKLALLFACEFSGCAEPAVKREIIAALEDLPRDQHVFLSNTVIDALGALGALDDEIEAQVAGIGDHIRALITAAECSATTDGAYAAWSCQFDHPYSSAYAEAIAKLAREERRRFVQLAGRGAPRDSFFASILVREVAAELGSASVPILERWLQPPCARESGPQEAIHAFALAHVALARLGIALPIDRPAPSRLPEEALTAACEALYWLNRHDLAQLDREAAARTAFDRFTAAGDAASAVLYELERCRLGEGPDRLPGDAPITLTLEKAFPDQIAILCRQAVSRRDRQLGYFEYSELSVIMERTIQRLGRCGTLADLDLLRELATDKQLGQAAVRAIADLERLLLVSRG